MFALSYDQLASNAQRLFRRLALVPGRDFDAHLAAVLGDMTLDDAWEALDDLVDLGLLHDAAGSRYRFHDLVRLFARHVLHAEDSADLRKTVEDTMTTWLLRNATAAGRWFEPAYGSPPPESAGMAPLSTMDEADHWLRTEAENWLAALRAAADAGRHDIVLDCAESMHWFSDQWMHGPHWQEVFTLGADAAAALGDLAQQATQLNYLAWVHLVPRGATVATNLGPLSPEIATRYADQALELATRSGATAQVGWSHFYIANALRKSGRLDEATTAAGKAAEVFKAVGDIDGYCQCLTILAFCLRDAGRYDEALRALGERHDLENDENSTMTPSIAEYGQPLTLIRIGECHGLLGRRAEAITALTRAVGLLEKFPISSPHTLAWEMLAGVLADDSRIAESRHAYARAADAFDAIGDADASRRCHDLATAAS